MPRQPLVSVASPQHHPSLRTSAIVYDQPISWPIFYLWGDADGGGDWCGEDGKDNGGGERCGHVMIVMIEMIKMRKKRRRIRKKKMIK